jgi:hypothetical protein
MLSCGVSTNFLLTSQNSLWYQILVTYMYIPWQPILVFSHTSEHKKSYTTIALSLTHIFNHAIITSCFPYEWKAARLLPLHKKGPQDLPENYRPISILPAISKVMERIMYDQIYEYLMIIRSFLNTSLVSANLIQLLRLFWIARTVGTLIWTAKSLIWLYYWI